MKTEFSELSDQSNVVKKVLSLDQFNAPLINIYVLNIIKYLITLFYFYFFLFLYLTYPSLLNGSA